MKNEDKITQGVSFNYKDFAEYLEINSISKIELAKSLLIDESTLNKYINGTQIPSQPMLMKICAYLDVPMDYFCKSHYKFQNEILADYMKENNITRPQLATILNLANSTIDKYFDGTRTPSVETLMQISAYTGLSMDYLCGIEAENIYEKKWLEQQNVTSEITAAIKKLISNEVKENLLRNVREHKKNECKRFIQALFTTEVDGELGRKPYIEVFIENILNLIIVAKFEDESFLKKFIKNERKLSIKVNSYKTIIADKVAYDENNELIYKKEDLDKSFDDILNESKEVKHCYNDTLDILYKTIKELVYVTLQEEFNNIKPDIKLL